MAVTRTVRSFLSMLGLLVACYAGIALLVWAVQERLVYFPERSLTTNPRAMGFRYEEVALTAEDGVRLHGWFFPTASARSTLLFLHGNAGNVSHRLEKIRLFQNMSLNVLIVDYRGYGKSEGAPNEKGTYLDARAAWNYLTQTRGVAAADIVLYGESLGGAVAANLATQIQPRALIVDSSFTSMTDLGAELYPWLPVRWISRFDYSVKDKIDKVSAPVLVIHSRQDEIVPFAHGERLFAAAREPKRFLECRGSHNDGFLSTGAYYIEGIAGFLNSTAR
jgi:fermentation-respiration switch protein FrsA (DUF1100 family)